MRALLTHWTAEWDYLFPTDELSWRIRPKNEDDEDPYDGPASVVDIVFNLGPHDGGLGEIQMMATRFQLAQEGKLNDDSILTWGFDIWFCPGYVLLVDQYQDKYVALISADDFSRLLAWVTPIVEAQFDESASFPDFELMIRAGGDEAWKQFRQLRAEAGLNPEPFRDYDTDQF